MKIGYLGPKNSFTFQAAIQHFEEQRLIPYASIPLTIEALEEGVIDYAVVPVENSLEGSVNATIDTLFGKKQIHVTHEIILPIRQQLLTTAGQIDITKILSHPQALAQSAKFLKKYYPKVPLEAASSTTAAAKYVHDHPEESCGAIASEKAAAEYELTILKKDIQDNAWNQTRFWVLSKTTLIPSMDDATKTTLFLTLPANHAGALHKILSAFSWRDIDLSKIESRPLKTSLGEYFFVIDLVQEKPWKLVENAIEEIRLLGSQVQVVGRYPVLIVEE